MYADHGDRPAAPLYRVWVAGLGIVATADRFSRAMAEALHLSGPDDVVSIDRLADGTRGTYITQAQYLPTGPGRGWDFAGLGDGIAR